MQGLVFFCLIKWMFSTTGYVTNMQEHVKTTQRSGIDSLSRRAGSECLNATNKHNKTASWCQCRYYLHYTMLE